MQGKQPCEALGGYEAEGRKARWEKRPDTVVHMNIKFSSLCFQTITQRDLLVAKYKHKFPDFTMHAKSIY